MFFAYSSASTLGIYSADAADNDILACLTLFSFYSTYNHEFTLISKVLWFGKRTSAGTTVKKISAISSRKRLKSCYNQQ